jgi:hypothetical protein
MDYSDTVREILRNGRRILDDAQTLEFSAPPATPFYLSIIAQEEYAKGFLLLLVRDGVIPWNSRLLQVARDHACKQLLGVVMDYLNPDTDTFISRMKSLQSFGEYLPPIVADALNILRHEKIGRWDSKSWCWAEDPNYDSDAVDIAAGKHDRRKQDAIYLRLGSDASVASTPQWVTADMYTVERDKATRFGQLVDSILSEPEYRGWDHERVTESFRLLFTNIRPARRP